MSLTVEVVIFVGRRIMSDSRGRWRRHNKVSLRDWISSVGSISGILVPLGILLGKSRTLTLRGIFSDLVQ